MKLKVMQWFRRVAFTLVSLVLGLVLLAALVFQTQGISYTSALYLLPYLIGVMLMYCAVKLFGRSSVPVILAAELLLLVVFVRALFEYTNELPLDFVILGACMLIGVFASEQRDPYTIGDVFRLSGWDRVRRVYHGSIKTTSVVTIFTYGAFRLAEYTITNMNSDSSLGLLLLIPMAIVAVGEFVRREIKTS